MAVCFLNGTHWFLKLSIMPVTDFIINKYEEWKSLYGPPYDPEFYIRKKTGGIVYVNV